MKSKDRLDNMAGGADASANLAVDAMQMSWSLWQFVPSELRAVLAAQATVRHFTSGQTVFHQGDAPTAIYGLVSGAIRHEVSVGEAAPALVSVLPRNHWFGEVAACGGFDHAYSAVCSGDVTAIELPVAALNQLIDTLPAMARLCMRWMASKERLMRAYLAETNAFTLEVRLARCLVTLQQVFSEPYDGGRILTIELSQEDYGDLMGATRQRINQIIQNWVHSGLIEARYKHIVIRNHDALSALSGTLNTPVLSFMQPSLVRSAASA